MSEFSVPISISQRRSPLATPEQESEEVQIIVWMLQHHLLIQLHTYVQIVVDEPILTSTKSPFRNAKTVLTISNINYSGTSVRFNIILPTNNF